MKQLVLLLNSAELDAVLAEVHRLGWGSAELKQAEKGLAESLAAGPEKVVPNGHAGY